MGLIRLRTAVPGPRAKELLGRRECFVAPGVSAATPLFVERAAGAVVEDVDGNVLIDFAGGIGVLNAGHCPPPVVEAVRDQVGRFLHTCFMVVGYESYVDLAEALAKVAPGPTPKKDMFVNSGAEAVENGVKIARKATGRQAVVCFDHAFHGRTLLTMTLTGHLMPYKDGFGPFAPEVYRFPYAYCYRCAYGKTHPGCGLYCLGAFEEGLEEKVGGRNVAALVVEPVQGEGGFIVPPPGYLRGLKEICEKYGILFVADEVQTGFGRTGKLFAVEHDGIEPDLLLVAKSIAAGLPLAGVIGKAEVMDAVHKGGIGGTYGGNPLSCAAALEVLKIINDPAILARGRQVGERLAEFCRDLQARHPLVGDVRALGAMVAMELVKDRETKEPATAETAAIIQYAYEHGLILLKAGRYGNVLRFLPPLVITDEQLEEGLSVLREAVARVTGR
ncbi:MAG: 4-aminobutyrate--2-oxoglutarate transaminase [Bacillota bacterium]|nr:4-aminobutyrate--2-oxoglutarate transaminase [Bacillota bacterium]